MCETAFAIEEDRICLGHLQESVSMKRFGGAALTSAIIHGQGHHPPTWSKRLTSLPLPTSSLQLLHHWLQYITATTTLEAPDGSQSTKNLRLSYPGSFVPLSAQERFGISARWFHALHPIPFPTQANPMGSSQRPQRWAIFGNQSVNFSNDI